MRKMKSLVDFRLSDNPLTSPPASVSISINDSFVFERSNSFRDVLLHSFPRRISFSNKTVRAITSPIELPFPSVCLRNRLRNRCLSLRTLFETLLLIYESIPRCSRRSGIAHIISIPPGKWQNVPSLRREHSCVTKATVLTAGFSYAFAGERTFSSTWRGRQRSTRGPEAVERGGRLWTQGVTRRWTWGRTGGTTSTAGTAPATGSTSAGPRKSTARLVSPSLSSPFRYRYTFCTRSTATSTRSYSASPPPNRPRTSDPKRFSADTVGHMNKRLYFFEGNFEE